MNKLSVKFIKNLYKKRLKNNGIQYIIFLIILGLLFPFIAYFATQTSTLLLRPAPLPTQKPLPTANTSLFEDSIILSFNLEPMFENSFLSRLVAIDPANRLKEQIVYKMEDPRDSIESMKWSPDRKKLAFGYYKYMDRNGNNPYLKPELAIITKNKKTPTAINLNTVLDTLIYDWQNESTLYFVSENEKELVNELYKYDLNKNSSAYVATIPRIDSMQVNRDYVYFTANRQNSSRDVGTALDYNIYRLNVNNPEKIETIISSKTEIKNYFISPDGEYLAYLPLCKYENGGKCTEWDLTFYNLETKSIKETTFVSTDFKLMGISPDGKYIAIGKGDGYNERFEISIVDSQGNKKGQINRSGISFSFGPHGKIAILENANVFISDIDGKNTKIIPIDDGEDSSSTTEPSNIAW